MPKVSAIMTHPCCNEIWSSTDPCYFIKSKDCTRQHINSKSRCHVKSNCVAINKSNTNFKKYILPSSLLSNVCHITNKVDELFAVVSTNNPTVTLIAESWLSKDILDNAINIGGKYNPFRLDRSTPGGGVLPYVDTTIPIDRLFNLEVDGKEVMWLLLKPRRTPRPL